MKLGRKLSLRVAGDGAEQPKLQELARRMQATVEFCEFNANGNTNASSSSPTHNIYVYGGYLTMRYCYVHDPSPDPDEPRRQWEAAIEERDRKAWAAATC